MPLTKSQIDRLTYDRAQLVSPDGTAKAQPPMQVLWDTRGIPGFGVRVLPSGGKSFVLWYRTDTGRKRFVTLGRYGVLTLPEARQKALEALRAIGAGSDPLGDRQADRQAVTVRAFADTYLTRHAKPAKKSWQADERRLRDHVIPALGHHKLCDVTRADVSRLHHRIGQEEGKPYEANRVLALVAVMFAKAQEWGYLPESGPNPARHVQPNRERSRDRFVRGAELAALHAAIDAEPNEYVRAAFKLYLLTGLRRSELLSLKWSDVALTEATLRLPDTKAGRPHTVPLVADALTILRGLPRMLGNPYVLPGHLPRRPLVNVTKPWRRIRARLWLTMHPEEATQLRAEAEATTRARKDASKHTSERAAAVEARLLVLAERATATDEVIRLHDLRRTFGSWMAMSGASLPVIGRTLGHSNTSTTQVYARLAEDAPRAAMEAAVASMAQARGGQVIA